jgi:O-antigen ligase
MTIATARSLRPRTRRTPLWRSREEFFADAGLLLLGAAGAYSFSIVGALPGDEILLFPVLPVLLLARGRRAFNRQYLLFYILAVAWLLGTLIADVYNGSPTSSRMKGVARVVFFALDFMALAILINNKARRMVIFALSIVVVMLFISRNFSGEFLTEWKFGLSSSVTILGLLASSYYFAKQKYGICIGISLALAALNLYYAFRSQMLIVLVSVVFTLPIFADRGRLRAGRKSGAPSRFKLIILLALAGGAAYLANQTIKFAADRGVFTENLSDKFSTQSRGKLGVLFGGRPETLVAIQAIRESPIIGHGSFPYSPKYMQLMQDYQYEYGYSESDTVEEIEYPVIPTHSHLTMAWVESGILGGLLWIYILVLATRAVLRIAVVRPDLSPLYCYLLVNFLWDILFSPLGSVNRLWGAYSILICYGVLSAPLKEACPAAMRGRILFRQRSIVRLTSRQVF